MRCWPSWPSITTTPCIACATSAWPRPAGPGSWAAAGTGASWWPARRRSRAVSAGGGRRLGRAPRGGLRVGARGRARRGDGGRGDRARRRVRRRENPQLAALRRRRAHRRRLRGRRAGGRVIGVVLAAGPGSRLGALTAQIPKTLLPLDGERTILDGTLANLAAVGIDDVLVVTGFAHHRVAERAPQLQERHGVRQELLHND